MRCPGTSPALLAGPDRARVAEHIAGCAACAAEAELLRVAHQAMMRDVPRIDIGRIVAALPAPPRAATGPVLVQSDAGVESSGRAVRPAAQRPARASGFRPMLTGWRIAAAISMVAVGGLSVAVIRQLGAPPVPAAVTAVVALGTSTQSVSSATAGHPEQIAAADPGLSLGTGLSDLSDVEMEGLLKDLDGIEASPSDEPDAAAPGLHAAVVQ